ncbi:MULTISPECIES: 6-phospho-beta-glucosidase [unclassified Actinomyces]|uniref:6-phospho-beta-glucosidase n=1 Tax=unclassified Actinomyces TaxID=2609248 RepID=UPI0020178DDC|nr:MULTISPECIES: 6-phospho-beta-glucosidase [unclassified Actinomyces]MCL3777229.1 6-phospho-beta-glucosidase [Actinomyces sp. AC-20-1]MCL3790377.1 6-phospho-beta-glucosidase [Actinomyces sp. 187325]MCL3792670.1 6-phospho-beta-glucosidase [Actinomyces sp. 186855]MCL3795158.1 6-phospho-beta-glucosidase [Actinomyces sp. 217892]
MKLVIAGGGGFRVPQVAEVLAQARAGTGAYPGLVVDELCLYDSSQRRLDVMRAVLADLDYPQAPTITSTTDLREAVTGAGFIFSAIRVGGTHGRVIDERVALAHGVLGQETVGVGGYAYAFRTIPVAMELARAVRDLAPEAWVINFTNPAGIITQAMRTVLGDRVVGICDTPIGLVRRVTAAVGGDAVRVSTVEGTAAGDAVDFDYVGLNHLGWLRSLSLGGQERLPGLLADDAALDHIEEARTIGVDWIRALGMLPNEYLFYYYLNRESVARILAEERTRGEFLERQQRAFYEAAERDPRSAGRLWTAAHDEREATYMAESRDESERAGRREEDLAGGGYQQVALDLMTAVSTGTSARMILDVGNADASDGAGLLIPQLREDAVIEVPCVVDADGVHPRRVAALGGTELGLVTTVKGCEELVIDAALSGDRALAWRALASHPLVDSVTVARDVLDGYLDQNPQVAATFRR